MAQPLLAPVTMAVRPCRRISMGFPWSMGRRRRQDASSWQAAFRCDAASGARTPMIFCHAPVRLFGLRSRACLPEHSPRDTTITIRRQSIWIRTPLAGAAPAAAPPGEPSARTSAPATPALSDDEYALQVAARLDRLPYSRTARHFVFLISIGAIFELYDLFMTGLYRARAGQERAVRHAARCTSSA